MLLSDPLALSTLVNHLSNGGDLPALADLWQLRTCDLSAWLQSDPVRRESYEQALRVRSEWLAAYVVREIRKVADTTLKDSDKLKALELLGKTVKLFLTDAAIHVNVTHITAIAYHDARLVPVGVLVPGMDDVNRLGERVGAD